MTWHTLIGLHRAHADKCQLLALEEGRGMIRCLLPLRAMVGDYMTAIDIDDEEMLFYLLAYEIEDLEIMK